MVEHDVIRQEVLDVLSFSSGGQNLDPLFELLGSDQSPESHFGPTDLIKVGRDWWKKEEPKLRRSICSNKAIQRVADGDLAAVATEIAGLLMDSFGLGTASKIAVIVAAGGVKTWCKLEWKVVGDDSRS